MSDGACFYILRCSDGSYYSGTARAGLEQRIAEHNSGSYGGYRYASPSLFGVLAVV